MKKSLFTITACLLVTLPAPALADFDVSMRQLFNGFKAGYYSRSDVIDIIQECNQWPDCHIVRGINSDGDDPFLDKDVSYNQEQARQWIMKVGTEVPKTVEPPKVSVVR